MIPRRMTGTCRGGRRRIAHSFEEVGDEARLADPRRPEQREQAAGAVGNGVFVVLREAPALALAAHERCSRWRASGAASLDHLEEPIGLTGSDFPLS